MTPEAQRIAIAEACGWKNVHRFDKWKEGGTASHKDGDLVGDFEGITRRHLPRYLNDLNAMHEAEKVLSDDQDLDYSEALESVVRGRWNCNNSEDMRRLRSATAAQRAEAFLRTLNLWQE